MAKIAGLFCVWMGDGGSCQAFRQRGADGCINAGDEDEAGRAVSEHWFAERRAGKGLGPSAPGYSAGQ